MWPRFADENCVYLTSQYESAREWAEAGLGILETRQRRLMGSSSISKDIRLSVLQIETYGLYPWLLTIDHNTGFVTEYCYQGDMPPELITVV